MTPESYSPMQTDDEYIFQERQIKLNTFGGVNFRILIINFNIEYLYIFNNGSNTNPWSTTIVSIYTADQRKDYKKQMLHHFILSRKSFCR